MNSNNILLSIIVPAYNQRKYIAECVTSLTNQIPDNAEVIIINDGSTDDTENVCNALMHDSRVRYVFQEHMGPGPARNHGISIANGEWLMFVDADDVIVDGTIKELLEFVDSHSYDMVYFDEVVCDEQLGPVFLRPTYPETTQDIPHGGAYKNCLDPAHIASRILKKILFENIRFKNIWYEDMAIFPYLICQASSIGYYKVPVYKYRQHDKSITHIDNDDKNLDVIESWNSALEVKETKENLEYIDFAVRSSLHQFCTFKLLYANRYIEWYNENLVREVKTDRNPHIPKEYPYKTQARIFSKKDFRAIQAFEKIYNYGGYYTDEDNEVEKMSEYGVWVDVRNGNPVLLQLFFPSHASYIRHVLEEISRTNLISLHCNIKNGVIDAICFKLAIIDGCKIFS